jgi:hypothetical protein
MMGLLDCSVTVQQSTIQQFKVKPACQRWAFTLMTVLQITLLTLA